MIYNISDGIFIRSPGSCPRRGTWGYWGVGGQKFIFSEIQPNLVCELRKWHVQWHNFFGPRPLGPWGGTKRSNIFKFQLQSQFQRFLNQTLCVFLQMKDIKHIRRYFHTVARVMHGDLRWGAIECVLVFFNM